MNGSAREIPAVDRVIGAGNEARAITGEPSDHLGDFLGFAKATERMHAREPCAVRLIMPLRPGVVDVTGSDGVDADAGDAVFPRDCLRQADDAVLGADIGSDPFAADLAEDRRDVDDRAAASLQHGPDLRANTKENAGQIDVDHLLPLADRKVRGEGGVASDACIVAGNVQPAERLRGGGDESVMIFGPPSIGVSIKCAPASLFYEVYGVRALLIVDVADDDALAFTRIGECDRSPDPLGGAGDERRFAREILIYVLMPGRCFESR